MESSVTTNLSEATADFVRLFEPSSRAYRDVRDLFVSQSSVTAPEAVEIQVGDEVDTELQYSNPNNNQVPALQGLLQYLDQQYPAAPVNKYYTTHRKHTHRRDGDAHTTLLRRTTQKRDVRLLLDVYAPVIYNKRVQVDKQQDQSLSLRMGAWLSRLQTGARATAEPH